MRSDETWSMRLTTHVTLVPDSTSPVGGGFDSAGLGGSISRFLDAVHELGLAALATAIRQNHRSEQEAGDEGEIEVHNERKGMVIYRYSKERHRTEAGTESAVHHHAFIRSAGCYTAGNVSQKHACCTHGSDFGTGSVPRHSLFVLITPQLTSQHWGLTL